MLTIYCYTETKLQVSVLLGSPHSMQSNECTLSASGTPEIGQAALTAKLTLPKLRTHFKLSGFTLLGLS